MPGSALDVEDASLNKKGKNPCPLTKSQSRHCGLWRICPWCLSSSWLSLSVLLDNSWRRDLPPIWIGQSQEPRTIWILVFPFWSSWTLTHTKKLGTQHGGSKMGSLSLRSSQILRQLYSLAVINALQWILEDPVGRRWEMFPLVWGDVGRWVTCYPGVGKQHGNTSPRGKKAALGCLFSVQPWSPGSTLSKAFYLSECLPSLLCKMGMLTWSAPIGIISSNWDGFSLWMTASHLGGSHALPQHLFCSSVIYGTPTKHLPLSHTFT